PRGSRAGGQAEYTKSGRFGEPPLRARGTAWRGHDRAARLDPRLPADHNCRMSTARFPTITAEALEALRSRIGQGVPRPEPYIDVATRDAIRHWAQGIGDRSPFWAKAQV